jgi:hypothetical protein
MLRLLSECAGLHAARDMLVTIRGPQVAGLRLVRLVVTAVDHLLHSVLELQHQVAERGGADFLDFLLYCDSPYLLMSILQTCSMDAISPDSGLQRQPYTGKSHMRALVSKSVLFGLLLLAPSFLRTQTPEASQMVPKQDSWFAHPEILCSALARQGYRAGAWRQLAPGTPVYQCEYPALAIREVIRDASAQLVDELAPQRPVPTSLTFQVSGGYPDRVDRISISITANTPQAMPAAKTQMLACIRDLYGTIGKTLPRDLPAYVEREQHYLSHQTYGTVSFVSVPERGDLKPSIGKVLWFRMGKNP